MTRRRGFSIAEALVAAALVAIVGGAFVQALATSTAANARLTLASQARRLLQYDLEQIRSGGGIPASGTQGPFTVSVTSQAAPAPATLCCTAVTTGVASLTQVTIAITAADGSVLASGTAITQPR